MSLQKAEAGITKGVKTGKNKERKQLQSYLNSKWQYASSTAYSKQFRNYKLIEMINEITFYLHDAENGQSLLLENEQYILLSIIRAISGVIDGKSSTNKQLLEMRLQEFTDLSGA